MQRKWSSGLALVTLCICALFLTRAFVSSTQAGSACPSDSDSNGETVHCHNDSSDSDINTNDGNDKVTLENSDEDDIHTNGGNDTVKVTDNSNVDEIHTSDGNDSITFDNDSGADEVHAGDGQDTLSFNNNSGAGSVDGGHQDDKITFNNDSGAEYVDGGHGEDTIQFTNDSSAQSVDGNNGSDLITFDKSSGADFVDGGSGADTIITNGSHSKIDAGSGDDVVEVGDGAYVDDLIDGGSGFNVLQFKFTVHSKAEKDAFQQQLDSQSVSGGYVTFGNKTYEWVNFDQLLNLLRIAASQSDGNVVVSVIGDNRLNKQDPAAPVAVYCNGGTIEVWVIGAGGQGNLVLSAHESALPQSANGVTIALNGDQVTTTYGSYSTSFPANVCPG